MPSCYIEGSGEKMNFSKEYLVLFVPHMFFALSVHEAAHAYVAYLRGDDTAAMMGRVTLNPLKHLDPFGLIAFFLIGFGWAKPVPVNSLRLRNPRRDNLLISLAGPGSNLVIGLLLLSIILMLFYGIKIRTGPAADLMAFLLVGAQLNIGLCFFNLIPVPPLDGSHVLMGVLPEQMANQIEPLFARGMFVLIAVVVVSSLLKLDIFSYIVWKPVNFIIANVLGMNAAHTAVEALRNFIGP
jgi:Zn-dependent protease